MSDTGAFKSLIAAVGPTALDHLQAVERRLGELVTDRDPAVAKPAAETLAAGGKRLRPLLVLVSGGTTAADFDQSETAKRELVSAATAVELVHMATLVHDDVLDCADLRRGKPTVFAANGREIAAATGDLLFALAFIELTGSGNAGQVRALSEASSALANGELMQREDAWDTSVTRDRYMRRCEMKTGRLFDAAAKLGAFAGGLNGRVDAVSEFGRRVGIAFQLADDVLDVTGDEVVTGKRRGTDLLDGTVNLPLIIARDRDPQLAQLNLRTLADPDAAAALCDRIAATGAPEEVTAIALALVADAKQHVASQLSGGELEVFELIADQAVARAA